jgi:ABC-type nitrate/sulfonate/bicarbonate transport system permease component
VSAATEAVRVPRTYALSPGARTLAIRIGTGIILLALWEGLVTWLAPSYVARPSGVVKVLPDVLSNKANVFTQLSGSFWTDVRLTVVAVLEGLAIGASLGVVVGLTMGRLRDVESLLKFYVNAFFAMPVIAILPLMTLWFGYTGRARLAIVILGAFLPVALNVFDGVRRLPTEFIEVSRTYHARWWNVWFGIALPASLPYLLAGFRLAAGRALVAAVVAEYLLAIHGLGYYILANSRSFHQNEATVAVLMLALIGVTINLSLDLATRRFLPWYRRA